VPTAPNVISALAAARTSHFVHLIPPPQNFCPLAHFAFRFNPPFRHGQQILIFSSTVTSSSLAILPVYAAAPPLYPPTPRSPRRAHVLHLPVLLLPPQNSITAPPSYNRSTVSTSPLNWLFFYPPARKLQILRI